MAALCNHYKGMASDWSTQYVKNEEPPTHHTWNLWLVLKIVRLLSGGTFVQWLQGILVGGTLGNGVLHFASDMILKLQYGFEGYSTVLSVLQMSTVVQSDQ